MNKYWKYRNKNTMMEARFEFDDFVVVREFLDILAEKADALEHHPNVSFGKNYVSIAIYAKSGELSEIDFELASNIDESFDNQQSHKVLKNKRGNL